MTHHPLSPQLLRMSGGFSMKAMAKKYGLNSPTRRMKSAYRHTGKKVHKYAKKYGVSSPLRRVKGFAADISGYVSRMYSKGRKTLKSWK